MQKQKAPVNPIEQKLDSLFRPGMLTGTQLIITRTCGFELFGSYETYDAGYFITVPAIKPSTGWALESDNLGQREIKVKSASLTVGIERLEKAMQEINVCVACNYRFSTASIMGVRCLECRQREDFIQKIGDRIDEWEDLKKHDIVSIDIYSIDEEIRRAKANIEYLENNFESPPYNLPF